MRFKKDFKVNITKLTTAVSQRGFGTILVLSTEQDHEVTVYPDVITVASDFAESTETYRMANHLFSQGVDEIMIAGEESELGTDLVAKLNEVSQINDSYFGVVCTSNSDTVIESIAGWVDAQEKVYAVTSQDLTIESASDHTLIAYHPTDNLAEKALAYMLTKEIGGTDLDGKRISGVVTSGVSATEYGVLKDNNINVAIEKFGNVVIDGGDMAGGEKFDVILGEFWIKIRMEEDLAALKVNVPKIPYTDAGVALLVGAANTRLKMATLRGIIATDADGLPEYEVTYLPVSEVPMNDRANRKYDYVKWTARLSGAIRTGTIHGILTI